MLIDKKIDCMYSSLFMPTLCLVILSTSHSTCYIHVVCTMYVVSAYILDGMASAAVVKERVISDH